MTPYTDIELRRAFALTAYKPAGLDFETAMRNPLYAKVIEAKAASDRQLRRELARRAEYARAGRWLELRADRLALIAGRPVTRVPHDCKAFRAAPRPAHVVLHAVRMARWIAAITLAGLATWALLAGGLALDLIFGALP